VPAVYFYLVSQPLIEPLLLLLVAARSRRVARGTGGGLAQAPVTAKLGAMGQTSSTPADVLAFWIGPLDADGLASADSAARWWRKDSGFDAAIRQTYEPTWERAMAGAHEDWQATAHGALALVIVLDQFSRNMFRGTPAAFATDARAFGIAEAAVALGFDQGLPAARRQFLYLPFEHAEDARAQARSVALFAPLGPEFLRWAEAHKAIIDRFGRFPHRNAILGRVSTPEEIAFLAGPDSAF
jgi:uncharacterized protein (DUF924 family)